MKYKVTIFRNCKSLTNFEDPQQFQKLNPLDLLEISTNNLYIYLDLLNY